MKTVLLSGESAPTSIVYNYLAKEIDISAVLVEKRVPATQILKRRLKSLGYVKVAGQVLFQTLVVRYLQRKSEGRIKEILTKGNLQDTPVPSGKVIHVPSVNDASVVEILREISPDVIVVNGTRIISKKVLDAVPATFINMHVGITPGYRGVHGAYWALVNNDKANAGVTIHYVDKGIDTGKVIAQATIDVAKEDNFVTYPYLQFAKGLDLLLLVLKDLERNLEPESTPRVSFSKLWTHPTIGEYFYNLMIKGVK